MLIFQIGKPEIIPQELQTALIGKIVLFKVQVRSGIDSTRDRPYTVLKVCTNADILQQYMIKSNFYEREFGKTGVAVEDKEYDVEKEFNEECESLSQITQLPIVSPIVSGKVVIEEGGFLSQTTQLETDGDSLQVYFVFSESFLFN